MLTFALSNYYTSPPMMYLLFVVLTFVISAVIGWFTIPKIVIIAKMKRLFDTPNARKVHAGAVPRLGGLSFFPASLFSFAFVLGLRYYYGYDISLDLQINLLIELLFVVSGMLVLYFVGMVDDIVGVGYKSKFIAQILAAACLVYAGVTVNNFQGLFGIYQLPYVVDVTLTVLLAVMVVNAFNLIDGVDGLCSGLGAIILTSLGVWYIYLGLYVYAMFAFGMVGVLIAFFQYNVLGTRLKIFMGDTGSLTLGYMITFLSLKFLNLGSSTFIDVPFTSTLAIVAGLLMIPLFDTARVFFNRIRMGKSPFYPDKNHIHHKLLRLKMTHLQSTGTLLLAQVALIVFNIVLAEYIKLNINFIIAIDIFMGIGVNIILNRSIAKYGRQLTKGEVITKNGNIEDDE